LYVTYNENVLRSGLLYTQVIRVLELMRTSGRIGSVVLLSIMSPQLLWRERRSFSELKLRLSQSGIRLIRFPMLIPQCWSWVTFPGLLLWTLPIVLVGLLYRRNIIHPRGYAAGLLGMLAAGVLGITFLFDPRGPYPEEMVMNRVWRKEGPTFRLWKWIEGRLIRDADAVVGVTPEYRDEFHTRGARRARFVPNRADCERFSTDKKSSVQSGSYNRNVGPCELLFIGELDSVWNNPTLIAQHFEAVVKRHPSARLRLITRARVDNVLSELEKRGINTNAVIHRSGTPEEMPELMKGASFGLFFRAVEVRSLWPVKFAEYLAAGIPLLVDDGMVGLPVALVTKHRLGFVARPDVPDDYAAMDEILNNWDVWSERCAQFARRKLDIRSTVRQFIRIYRQVLSDDDR